MVLLQNLALLAHCPIFDHVAAWLNTACVEFKIISVYVLP